MKTLLALSLVFVLAGVIQAQQPSTSQLTEIPLERLLQFDVVESSPNQKKAKEKDSPDQVGLSNPEPFIDDPFIDSLTFPSVSRFAVGYHLNLARYEEHRSGREVIDSRKVIERFGRVMTRMDVESNIFYVAHRPSDKWMFQASVPTLRISGVIESVDGSKGAMVVEGVSDVNLNISRYFNLNPQTHYALNLGIGLPTGSIDEEKGGNVLPYSLQLGSGTVDLSPGIAGVKAFGLWEIGAAVKGDIHLGDNDRGYSYGNSILGSTWIEFDPNPYFELGAFIRGYHLEAVDDVPPDKPGALHRNPANYGGTYVDGGVSVKFKHPSCPYAGKYVQFRASKPLWQDVNGIHLTKDWSLDLGVGFSF